MNPKRKIPKGFIAGKKARHRPEEKNVSALCYRAPHAQEHAGTYMSTCM
jgi:hypothetical protein